MDREGGQGYLLLQCTAVFQFSAGGLAGVFGVGVTLGQWLAVDNGKRKPGMKIPGSESTLI